MASANAALVPYKDLLDKSLGAALKFLSNLPDRPVAPPVDFQQLLQRMGGPLSVDGEDPLHVIQHLAESADPGIVASAGPRYFGFVTGGSLPVAVAADWLASVWDQNAFSFVSSPAAAAAEEISRQWLLDLLGLPKETSLGFTTGATMANFTALAAARTALLRDLNWDIEAQGLFNAPPIVVVTSEDSHATIFAALQMLGLGRDRVVKVATDDQGRMLPAALRSVLDGIRTPVIVCAQPGNVNSGAFDPIAEIADSLSGRPAWLHVDGAFGMWAAASPEYRHLTAGIDRADSITVDGHKWLNVPYDCGFVFVQDHAAHHKAMTVSAPYYGAHSEIARENFNWVPDSSRRARGFAVYAVLRTLGRRGIAELVERCCRLARRLAGRLSHDPQVRILNDIVLNQVLVRFSNEDAITDDVIRRVQQDGVCWAGGTTWRGLRAMRISVSNWSTTEDDIDRSAGSILRCARGAGC